MVKADLQTRQFIQRLDASVSIAVLLVQLGQLQGDIGLFGEFQLDGNDGLFLGLSYRIL